MNDWDFPSKGWFLQWAVIKESRQNPMSSITVCDHEGPLCGYVPDNWDGSRITLIAK